MGKFNFRRAVAISVGVHILLMTAPLLVPTPVPPPSEALTVELLTQAPPTAKQRHAEVPAKQIVEQDQTVNDETPQKDAFLSAHNQRAEKATVAAEHGEFRNRAEQGRNGQTQPGPRKAQRDALADRPQPRLEDLLGSSPLAVMERRDRAARERTGDGSQGKRGVEASRTNDFLPDVDQGAETMLNTREFKYYTYYSRIRRQLSQYWEPRVRDKLAKMFRQGRQIASDQDHITKLLIVLNGDGKLVRVHVLSESGVSDLDDAATEAFRSAAPFPNPPHGIIEDDGTVKIRWDFVLES